MDKTYIYEDKDSPDLCMICGSDSAYYVFETEEDEDGKYYCTNCGCEYMYTGSEYRDVGELLILKGEKRDWLKYLGENLSFPFEGEIFESQERGHIKQGDAVVVNNVEFEDDFYGIIASIHLAKKKPLFLKNKKYSFPIADICAKDKKSANYKILDDYSIWFTNLKD